MNGLPNLRVLPDAPVPEGQTLLTARDASRARAVGGSGRHLGPFIPGTNTIEAMHRQVRKAIKTRGHFPDEQAATKLIYLAITRAEARWTKNRAWTSARAGLKIHFGDRFPG